MEYEFSRAELLLGKDGLNKLKNATVAVFGIGGVGTYAVEGLARCGVGNFVLVDKDLVSISNINRQLHATYDTIGKPKTLMMKDRILSINKNAKVKTFETLCLPENIDELISDDYSYIVDAVDMVTAKIALAAEAERRGIPTISAMGAGNKLDPTAFTVADIYETSVCPLCRVMRRELKARGVKSLKVVYSKEEPKKPQSDAVASVSFVPGVCGLIISSVVVKEILK